MPGHRQSKIFFTLLNAPVARITGHIRFIAARQRPCSGDITCVASCPDQGVNQP